MPKPSLAILAVCVLLCHFSKAQCPITITGGSIACVSSQFTLSTSPGAISYQWYDNNNQPIGNNTNILTTSSTAPGNMNYTVIAVFNTCTDTATIQMNIIQPAVTVATNNSPTCAYTLHLYASGCNYCTYTWTGPNNITASTQNVSIPNVLSHFNGIYTVTASNGYCTSTDTTIVNVLPGFTYNITNSGPVCLGDSLQLTADTVTWATYTWSGPGGFTCYQKDTTFAVDGNTQGGVYSVTVSASGCWSTDTTHVSTCNTMFVNLYNDLNSNCLFETGTDAGLSAPALIQIDSNSVPLDTIPAFDGIYYTPLGIAGDVYTFKIISLSGGLVPTCPVTGSVNQVFQPYNLSNIDIGVACNTVNSFDLGVTASDPASTAVSQIGYIYGYNTYCLTTNAVVTLQHSPKYEFNSSSPAPSNISGNTITWNLTGLDNDTYPASIHYWLKDNTMPLMAGDTTHSYISIAPSTGDQDITNNTWIKVDTVVASCDPNAIMAFPQSCIQAGDQLQYTIMFENVGNAPAENIYVLDTLPAGLEAGSMELLMSSHEMYVSKTHSGGDIIYRFDFPNINLPDSSDHAGCHGMLVYKINTSYTLPFGADINHRAGIYFDYNSVVMTNTYTTSICTPNNVSQVRGNKGIILYPNPASDELTLQANESFERCTISNSIGQVMMVQRLQSKTSKLNISALAPGIYYMSIKGEGVHEVLKFVKI